MSEKPQSRPEPAKPSPDVYGDRWGEAGKQNPEEPPHGADRPEPIDTPAEAEGSGDPDAQVDTQSDR
jgi:hypothetical protein